MAQPPVVSGLLRKRAELARAIAKAERYLRRLRAELMHVDAVLRLYGPERGAGDVPEALLPFRPTRWFKNGELPRRVFAALREAGPDGLTAEEVAAHVMAAKALDPNDAASRAAVRKGVTGCLRRRGRTGLIEAVAGQDGGAVRWRVALLTKIAATIAE